MANYVVSDTNLTLIADAIRAKSGHNELLEWPNEYKTSIDNLNPVDMCIKTATDDIVSVSDAAQYDAKNVSIKIEPVQDLHGYDSSWPAGGGKNMLPDITGARTTNSIFIGQADGTTYPIYLEANTAYSVSVIANSGAIGVQVYIKENGGSNIVFANGASGTYTPTQNMNVQMWVYAEELTSVSQFQLEKGSTPTAWTPYSNICPISGWTGAKVTRTGKNLLDTSYTTHNVYNIGSIPNTLKPNTTYMFSVNGSTTNKFRLYTAKSTAPLSALTPLNSGYLSKSDGAQTFTTPSTMDDLLCLAGNSNGAGNESLANILPQIELGSTATDYEPYQGDTYDIAFPAEAGTVYGGTLDVTNGVLTVDRAMVDLGTLTWTKITTSGDHWRFWAMLNTMRLRGQMISSQYRQIGATEQYIGTQGIANQASGSNVLAMVSDERYADAVAFKAAMSGVQLVYELATPVTYTLTPQQIALLRGNNTLWADTGDVTLKYFTTAFENLAEEIGFAEGGDY